MKVELEFKDLDEYSEFICALNNAVIAYQRVVYSIKLGVEIPSVFEKLAATKTEEELEARLDLLAEKYKELEKQEQFYLEPELWKKIKEKISHN